MKAKPNLEFIQKHSLEEFLGQQGKRIELLESMLNNFDDGRSRSFYCIATALLPIADLEKSLEETEQRLKADKTSLEDHAIKSGFLREFLKEAGARNGVDLRLRKKGEGQ